MPMQKMIGPLPLWGWIGVVVAGVGIAWVSSKGANTNDDSYVIDPNTGIGLGSPGWISVSPPPEADSDKQSVDTNEEWYRVAVEELLRKGYNAGTIDISLRKYLAGQSLNATEQAMVNAAIRIIGPPPYPLPPPYEEPETESPTPEPKPDPVPKPAPKPQQKIVTVVKWPAQNSTLWGIAQSQYGNALRWREIYNANRKVIGSNPDLIHPGMKLVIP